MKVNDEESDKATPSTASLTLATTSKTEAAIRCLQRCSVPFLSSHSTNWINNTATLNTRVPHTPALLVYARTVQNVQDAISCGVEAGLKVSARCGGHSYASFGLGGEDDHLIVDLTNLNSVNVDPTTHIATVGAGARLGDVATGLYNQGGRAISHGSCPAVGISGHILHGGYGWTSHNEGLTLDWMVGADVVLANGTQVHCSETENADLFWALRGAGSNFGIVTSYKVKTFAAPSLSIPFSVSLDWNTEDQKVNGVKELVEFARNMPVDLNMRLNIHNSGDHTFDGAYYGSVEDLFQILAPLLQKTGGTLNARPGTWIQGLEAYAEHNSLIPSTTDSSTFYATSLTLKDLCGTSLTNFVRYWHNTALKFNQGGWFVQLDLHGGPNSAISSVPNSATAYAHRDKAFLIQFYHYYDNTPYPPGGIKLLQEWVDSTTEPLQEGDWGMYINYVDSQLNRETAQKLYYGVNLERLRLLKKKYDPTELFYYPQSIEPAM
ncbi:putative FAD-linked oxidoreductase YvdP [Cytospora mali]|uniref:FAD-linked oxidoreductase YvdP n=1 Tax=Cytospora mali TaxID=578113 RepID=A0A194W9U1_CYTMA|nr:putative FAD-linked oxidoreductase YvdP [Valsa mali]